MQKCHAAEWKAHVPPHPDSDRRLRARGREGTRPGEANGRGGHRDSRGDPFHFFGFYGAELSRSLDQYEALVARKGKEILDEIVRAAPLGAADEAACLRLAASLEKASRHPAARAFHDHPGVTAEGVQVHAGKGVEGRAEGRRLRIGSGPFCGELCGRPLPSLESAGSALQTRVYLADETGWLAAFDLHDELRPAAASIVADLKARGLRVHLASGDRAEVISATAAILGIERFAGGMTPEAKLAYVERLRAQGGVVAVVGDGLNDTPVLASADVSIAMGSGADAAQLQSDVVLLSSKLDSIPETLDVARRAMRLVRQNVGWAIAYNALALPLAAVGWIGPWEAALGMGASSMAVLLNALRPFYPGEPWKASTFSSRSRSPSYS